MTPPPPAPPFANARKERRNAMAEKVVLVLLAQPGASDLLATENAPQVFARMAFAIAVAMEQESEAWA